MIKERLLHNWHALRVLRAGLGVVFLVQGLSRSEIAAGVLGAILMVQALLDLGCCSLGGGCGLPASRRTERQEETTWQEIR